MVVFGPPTNRPWGFAPLLTAIAMGLFGVALPGAAAGQVCPDLRCGCVADPAPAPAASGPLSITYYGVSTLIFGDGENRLLVDGFFTRPSERETLFGLIHSDPALVRARLGSAQPPIRAVLTAHAHHDHALDLVSVARTEAAAGAIVIGTPSVVKLARAGQVSPERTCAAADGDTFVFGAFTVTALAVDHGPSLLPLRLLLDRPMGRAPTGPAWFGSFRDHENFSWLIRHGNLRILVHPSAGIRKNGPVEADVAFLGLGRIGVSRERYWRRYFEHTLASSVSVVIPIHWDRFTSGPYGPLEPAGFPMDDAEAGFERLCRHLRPRSGTRVFLMQARNTVVFRSDGMPPEELQDDELCAD
jgi:L-ascorbate metabolism protein UlaG (beta-lactamase superfamily)